MIVRVPPPRYQFHTSLPPLGYLSLYTRAFTTRITLPIHPFVKDLSSPTQLVPNFWYCFTGMWVRWNKKFDMELPMDEFLYVYKLCQVVNCDGWYFLDSHGQSKPDLGKLIEGLPSSSHTWKSMFFIMKACLTVTPRISPLNVEGYKPHSGY